MLGQVAKLLSQKNSIIAGALTAQRDNLRLASRLHAGEPDELEELTESHVESPSSAPRGSRDPEPPRKSSRVVPDYIGRADRLCEEARLLENSKTLLGKTQEVLERIDLTYSKGAALKTILRHFQGRPYRG